MASFQEVMKQWGRLCRQHCAEHSDDCDGCLLGGTRADLCAAYVKDNAEDAAEIERLVMEWAEEHPEPVYPTWGEWLMKYFTGRPEKVDIPYLTGMIVSRGIDADTAQKLGIEPKK